MKTYLHTNALKRRNNMLANASNWQASRLKEPNKNDPTKSTTPSRSISLILATTFSVIGIVLTLLGYGTTLGIADFFNLDATDVYRSPFDFLLQSKDFLVWLFNGINLQEKNNAIYDQIIFNSKVATLFIFIGYVSFRILEENSTSRSRTKRILNTIKKSKMARYLHYPLAAIGSFSASFSLAWIFTFLFKVLILMIVFLPMIGYFAGRYQAKETIFMPAKCQIKYPQFSGSNKNETTGAICLLIRTKDGLEIARGRKIFRTSDQIFLYNRKQSSIKSIPLRDLIVEQIDTE